MGGPPLPPGQDGQDGRHLLEQNSELVLACDGESHSAGHSWAPWHLLYGKLRWEDCLS